MESIFSMKTQTLLNCRTQVQQFSNVPKNLFEIGISLENLYQCA